MERFHQTSEQPAEKREVAPLVPANPTISQESQTPSLLSRAAEAYRKRALELLPDIRRIHCPPSLLEEYDRIHGNSTMSGLYTPRV